MKEIKEYLDHLLLHSTPQKPAWNKEALLENHAPKWNYIDGCMMEAVLEMYEITKDPEYLEFVDDFIDYYVDEDGNIRGYLREEVNSESISGGKVLFGLYKITKKEKYKKAFDLLYSQLEIQPRTEGGKLLV